MHLPRDSRVYLRLRERGGDLELEYLLMFVPVDHKAKLDKIEPGKLCNVENDLRILPAGPLTSNPRDRPVLDHRG